MRIRTIKPEFWTHPVTGRLPGEVQAFLVSLLNLADDHGYFFADPVAVRSALRPFDESSENTRRLLDEASRIDWIEVRTHPTHGAIGRVLTFEEHQRVDRAKDSAIEKYWTVALDESSTIDRRRIDEGSTLEGKGREQGREAETVPLPVPVVELQAAWNETAGSVGCGRWVETPEHRLKAAKAAVKRRPLEQWRTVFAAIAADPFATGKDPKSNWKADVDYAIRPSGKHPEPALKYLERATTPPAHQTQATLRHL